MGNLLYEQVISVRLNEGVKLLYCVKIPMDVFYLYKEVVNILTLFITGTYRKSKHLLASYNLLVSEKL